MSAKLWAGLAAAVTLAAAPVRAATLVSQSLDASLVGTYSNIDPSHPTAQQIADEFTLPLAATIQSLQWQGRYGSNNAVPANPIDFTVRVFADDGGSPSRPAAKLIELLLSLVGVDTGTDFMGANWFGFSSVISPVSLPAGKYWISVSESDARTPSSGLQQWLWGLSALGSTARASRSGDADVWGITPGNQALVIGGEYVPEPAAGMLLAIGAIAPLVCRFARRRH